MIHFKRFFQELSGAIQPRPGKEEVHQGAIASLVRLGILLGSLSLMVFLGNGAYFLITHRDLQDLKTREKAYHHLRNDLHSVSASLFTLVQMRSPLTPDKRSLFRGYQIQGVSVLSDMGRRDPILLLQELPTLRSLTQLFVYASLQNIEREGFAEGPPGRPLIPPALASRMYGLIQGLDRRIEAHQRTTEMEASLIRHRRMTGGLVSFLLLLLVLFGIFFVESRSFSFLKTLEFEIDLTKQLIITSDIIREWKEFAKDLLLRINKSFPVNFLFTLFATPEDTYEVYVFWNGFPSDSVRDFFEGTITDRIRETALPPPEKPLVFFHEIADGAHLLSGDFTRKVMIETETLLLERPQIGGIVGVGLAGHDSDPVRKMVVRGFLVSVLNVLGSVKALSLYNKEMEFFAVRDPLTRLFNQRVFWELLEYEVGRATRHDTPFVLCVIDLDDFKRVNDTFGHALGDEYLKAISDLLMGEIRLGDILARYGGDEFVLILPESEITGALSFVERLRGKIAAFRLDPGDGRPPLDAAVSIGLAAFPNHAQNPQDLFTVADQMMYRAKQSGKNAVRAPTVEEAIHVHKAGKRESHLLDLVRGKRVIPYFQPFVDLATRKITGYEVLARLEEADGQIVPAAEFIALAEKAGLAAALDFDVLDRALALADEHRLTGQLFFNLTPSAMAIPDFVRRIQEMVGRHSLPPSRLAFEITEREAIKNVRIVETLIRELKDLGFAFSIDDFGAGFSSHHYLRAFPVDYLKIDAPFLQGAGKGHSVDLAIVQSIVKLATSLGVRTVGEGIETAEDLEAATLCGVTLGQGYFLGRPSPVNGGGA